MTTIEPYPTLAGHTDTWALLLTCGHHRTVSLVDLGVDPEDIDPLHLMCWTCYRTTLDRKKRCMRRVIKAEPAPPGWQPDGLAYVYDG